MATTLVGTVLDGKFQIERALASGASGDVYEAIHLGLGSRVAVKVLRQGLPQTALIRRKRFVREARVAARIQSDHVVRVFDIVAPEHGLIYIVMELLLGETLGDRIRRVGAMPPLEAVGYVLQAAKPLAAMHDAGIVHRDVKPSNIFLARDAEGNERVKLLDFGVAALQQPVARGESAITFTDALVGTPRYMAPEQVLASKDVDARADVWALGVTLYELLAGRQPFDGQTVLAVLNQIESQQPPPLVDLRPGIPPELAKLVHRCLAKDPAVRPADARALGEALAPFGGEVFRGEPAVPRRPSDPLDLSLSDDNVEIVRDHGSSARLAWLQSLFRRRTQVVTWGLVLVALGAASLVFATMRRPLAPPAATATGDTKTTPASVRLVTETPSALSPPVDSASAPALATVTMEPSRDPPTARHAADPARGTGAPRRPGKSPARPPASKVSAGRSPSDDDDRIE
jgi:serine/threonine-protein kinase